MAVYYICVCTCVISLLVFDSDLSMQIRDFRLMWPSLFIVSIVTSSYCLHIVRLRPGYIKLALNCVEIEGMPQRVEKLQKSEIFEITQNLEGEGLNLDHSNIFKPDPTQNPLDVSDLQDTTPNTSPHITTHEPHASQPPNHYCDHCQSPQPYRSRHCHDCQACVAKFDHHCFWIGGCVGELNHRPFVVTVMMASVTCLFAVVYVGLRLEGVGGYGL
jgi:DHHC palmitoyltransferase